MARLPGFTQGVIALDVGLRLGGQGQSLRRLCWRRVHGLAVDPAMKQVQDMGLRRGAGLQRQFDRGEHGLFVMLENQGEDLGHPAVAAWRLEHALLQSPEGGRQFGEGRAVAQGSRLALNDRQIVPPILTVVVLFCWGERAKTRRCSQTICPSAATTMRSGYTRKLTGRLAKDAGTL